MKCPKCGIAIPDEAVLKAGAAIMGAKAKGKKKARTSEQARAAVMVRWAKRDEKKP